jgi:hypothetical protein
MNSRFVRAAQFASVAAVAAAAILVPSQASAAASLDLNCFSLGNQRFKCTLSITGGTAPYTTTWTPIANAGITRGSTNGATGTCNQAYMNTTVKASVTDAVGGVSSQNDTFFCGDPA